MCCAVLGVGSVALLVDLQARELVLVAVRVPLLHLWMKVGGCVGCVDVGRVSQSVAPALSSP